MPSDVAKLTQIQWDFNTGRFKYLFICYSNRESDVILVNIILLASFKTFIQISDNVPNIKLVLTDNQLLNIFWKDIYHLLISIVTKCELPGVGFVQW